MTASSELRHARGRLPPPLPRGAPLQKRLARAGRRLVQGLVLHDALMAAPAMAFHFFLSLLPLLVFAGYVIGAIARRRGVEAVLSPLLDNLPGSADTLVRGEVARLAGSSTAALGPLALCTFVWIAAGGVHGLMNAIENVVGTTRRPWWRKRVLALGWVLGSVAVTAAAASALVAWDSTLHPRPSPPDANEPAKADATEQSKAGAPPSAHEITPGTAQPSTEPRRRRPRVVRSVPERGFGLVLGSAAAVAMLAAFYRFSVARAPRAPRRVWPGALLSAVSWFVISSGFAVYVRRLAEYTTLYGSVAAVAVLLVWLWLTSLTILIGAEFNSQLEGLRD